MQRVEVTQHYKLPVERIFAYLAEHEHLEPLFGAKITRVRDGEIERNGVGSIRSLRVAMLPAFEETVTAFVPNQLIEYRISKGSPLKNHRGVMTFAQSPDGCHLDYVIDFGAKIPGLDRLVKVGLARSIRTNLPRVESLA